MSFINGNYNQKINNRNNFYILRHGNNYNTPFKINNNNYINHEQNIQNNINNNYKDTLNKYEQGQNLINENNYQPYSYRNKLNGINENQNNYYNYRNYSPYAQYDPYNSNLNHKFRREDNFHYLAPNDINLPQNEIIKPNNNFDINNIGKIILSTESKESLDKQNKNRAQREYSDYLKQQIEEKNKRKKLERERLMEEDLRLEKENREYLKRQKEMLDKEREKEQEKYKKKDNLISFNSAKKPINQNENKKFLIDTDINKNLMENIKRAQTPLMYDHVKLNQEISNKYNNKNNFEINDIYKNNININNNNNSIRRPVSSTILQSGKGIIDGKIINYNKQSVDITNNNVNNNKNIENRNNNNYSNYKLGDIFNDINNEENTIKNNKYMDYNITNKDYNNSLKNINNDYKEYNNQTNKNKINLNETLFNRDKYNVNNNINQDLSNNTYINNNININNNNNYDYTFKNTEETEEKPFIINESLKGGSIEKILDLDNKIDISRSFENKNIEEENNIMETFGSNISNRVKKDNESTKGHYESINSNFTFGNNSQIKNKNNIGVDSIIKNINVDALNYFSKYENSKEENNNNKNEINLEQSLKSESKLISPSNKINLLSTWKKDNSLTGNDSIKEEIDNENEKDEKEFVFNSNNNNNLESKQSLNFKKSNKDLFITFGEMPQESIKLESDLQKNALKKNFEDEYLESEGIVNFYKETKKIKNTDISNRVNEALKDAKESSDEDNNNIDKEEEIKKINFFEDTIGKIKKKASNDIININDRQQLDMIISGEIEDIDTFKSGENFKKYK